MLKLRPYQEDISTRGSEIVKKHGFLLLAMEVRTGKTITSLAIAEKLSKKSVLFLTKKKAIPGIQKDCELFPGIHTDVTNYESIHKVSGTYDLVICDESHTLGTFPKASNKQKTVKKTFGHLDIILMSGTVTPESYSQFFHQFHVKMGGPWCQYKSFYRWADKFVDKHTIRTSYGEAIKYDRAKYKMIMEDISEFIITLTQKEAGFTTSVEEKKLFVKMTPKTYQLVAQLKKDKVIESGEEVILADTMVKEKSKIHQLYSGTIKTESGNHFILDSSKGKFIKKHFEGKKIAIYYNFKAERELLLKVFGDQVTESLSVFQKTDKNIILQIVSGREGISLKEADYIVFFNISFSAVSYWQARDRLTTKERSENTVYWIFSEGGMEEDIYKAVTKKKSFTTNMYKKIGELK